MKPFYAITISAIALSAIPNFAIAADTPATQLKKIERAINLKGAPGWHEPEFDNYMVKFLSPELIEVVSNARVNARKKKINLWDGNFFTGGQGIESIHFRAIKTADEEKVKATVKLKIGQSDTLEIKPENYGDYTAYFVKSGDDWLMDDIKYDNDEETRKTTFNAVND